MNLPEELGPEAYYFAALAEGRLVIQRCRDCKSHIFYPKVFCPVCEGQSLGWISPCGTGTVYSMTTIRQPAEGECDFNISLIDLDEGVRLMSRVDGVGPQDVKIGMRVRAKILNGTETALLVFEPIGAI